MAKGKKRTEKRKKPNNILPLGSVRNEEDPGDIFAEGAETRKGVGREDLEMLARGVIDELEKAGIQGEKEVCRFLEEAIGGRSLGGIFDSYEMTPEEQACDYVDQAGETEDPVEAVRLCAQALELDPFCVDAQVILARLVHDVDAEFLLALKCIIITHENHLGEEYMQGNRGHFWGILETRPYMRARMTLVHGLDTMGFPELAAREAEGMLELNPGDNQGVRDPLRAMYLTLGWLDKLDELNKTYSESGMVMADWSRVFGLFLRGKIDKAEKAARTAHQSNPHAIDYFSGRKKIPDDIPDCYALYSKDEAIIGAYTFSQAFEEHPEFQKWTRGLKGFDKPKKTKKKK